MSHAQTATAVVTPLPAASPSVRKHAGPRRGICPPSVSRGAKSNRSFLIDWLRFSLPASQLDTVVDLLTDVIGQSPERKGGLFFHVHRYDWSNVVRVCFTESADSCIVDVSGSGLALIEQGMSAEDFARWCMSLGGRATRLDLAVDFKGGEEPRWLIDRLYRSCSSGELVGARRYHLDRRESVTDGVVGDCVCIGTRGSDGSGRYVRVYDKGLETKSSDRGTWVRFEAEYSGDVAAQTAIEVFGPDDLPHADWVTRSLSHVFGAFDLRAVTGRREIKLRPRVSWWAALIESTTPVRVVAKRVASTAASWARWMSTAVVGQVLALAQAARATPDQVVRLACGHTGSRTKFLRTPAGSELAMYLRQAMGRTRGFA